MRVLRKLTTFYFIGIVFIIMIIIAAVFSFGDVYNSTDKILVFTRKLAERNPGFSSLESFQLNQLVDEIGRIQLRAYFFFSVSLLMVSTGLIYLIYTYKRNKEFNDTYGHQEGDAALRWLSNILSRNVRKIDSASRYGGEEFAITLTESSYNGGIRVAEKI
ncbi:MAG TPA: diguanylate cyclase [Nitrospirae bacterium]|nr:diguanylate cyclase DosC [bacterium BMS3Abin10]GBE37942.1 diguanylate cyclase DosC [bacterium BMS3Bbin08]HDH50212.1 diguanylate cyclase [Nitrospirota bacterium]HDK41378.1 diguanylate cyclase [Nitrospirota bacterium]HDK80961.1 diguanylate cyclase [Nitrospirota bacterium]